MKNIAKCNRCGSFVSAEFIDNHVCKVPINDVKKIKINYYFETKSNYKEDMIIAKGFDGVLYRLIVSKPKNFGYPSDELLQGNLSDADLTAPPIVILI